MKDLQLPSDYIYSVSAATEMAPEGYMYTLPIEIRGAISTELVESNGYVSAPSFSMSLVQKQQAEAKAAQDYLYASARAGNRPQETFCMEASYSGNYGKPTGQSEDLVASEEQSCKSVSYINGNKELEPHSICQDELNIVAERRAAHNEEAFMQPACDEWALYAQFKKIRVKLLEQNAIKMSSVLGSGQFGTVNQGIWETAKGPIPVAVKILNPNKKDSVDNKKFKIKFLREVAIMGQFCHPNVVALHGIVIEGETMMMVLELLEKGDLKQCLASTSPDLLSASAYDNTLSRNLLKYCQHIASGMEYLGEKAFIHRDLAARNVLLSHNDICKIADFGMSRDLEDDTYYISSGGKIPLRWTAPEALEYKKYSTASDVWSYGCVMYEIWSMGEKLYKNHSNYDILKVIESGYRIPPPPGCPRAIYKIMIECWHPLDSSRPSFTSIKQSLFQPEDVLLAWAEDDLQVHPQAKVIKAPLEAGYKLYEDLQNIYLHN